MGRYPVRRNTVLLAAGLTALSGMTQLAVAIGTTTLVLITGVESIVGLGPAIFLTTGALAAFPAGRAMDRHGRMPVIRIGFGIGILASVVLAFACETSSTPLVVVGLALIGCTMGSVILSRAAAADMYPPERRARSISVVLFGAVFGAALGPLVWRPLFTGKHHVDADTLVVPWLVAGGIMALGLLCAFLVRPDPKRIGEALGYGAQPDESGKAEPLAVILRRPGVLVALLAAVSSFGVMVAVMNLSGYMVVGHGHSQASTFWVISAHIVGMYGLVLFVGDLIDRIGRRVALVGGLVVMGVSTISLAWISSVGAMSLSLFGLGLGWVFAYVGATSELVDRAALVERGRLVGFSDLASGLTGATLALVCGAVYTEAGVGAAATLSTAAVAVPALVIALTSWRRPVEALEPAG